MRHSLNSKDVFKTDGIKVRNAGTDFDSQIRQLITAGFTDEQIIAKTYPTYNDADRWTSRKESFIRKIQQLRGEAD